MEMVRRSCQCDFLFHLQMMNISDSDVRRGVFEKSLVGSVCEESLVHIWDVFHCFPGLHKLSLEVSCIWMFHCWNSTWPSCGSSVCFPVKCCFLWMVVFSCYPKKPLTDMGLGLGLVVAKILDIVCGANSGGECRGWEIREIDGSMWCWLSTGLISCLVSRPVSFLQWCWWLSWKAMTVL